MAPIRWKPRVEITRQERFILKRCQSKRRLFAFLREHRHEILDDSLQAEFESMYRDTGAGLPSLPPGLMAMALILQGYHRVSDADAVELTVVDLRWQMVLDQLGSTEPAFSQGALFEFRERLIAHDMDRRLLERTAEIARRSGGFDARKLPKTLRVAMDSSPLEGAGRVEDTLNLIGHAARKVVTCAAEILERDFAVVCRQAGIPILLEPSVKKALDRDWSDPRQKAEAVDVLAKQVLSLERWLDNHLAEQVKHPPLKNLVEVLDQLVVQDLEPDPGGGPGFRIAEQVAEDRRVSVEDGEMRHGRKSKSKRFNGYKRHLATDMASDAILACALLPANRPEHEALPMLTEDIARQGLRIGEAHFDRGYMGSAAVDDIEAEGGDVICKPWRVPNGDLFAKEDFCLNLRDMTITCPAGRVEKITLGESVKFPAKRCDRCHLREQCTTAQRGHGRTVAIAPDERLQQRLRKMAQGPAGRERFRQRVTIEHRLAHLGYRQGRRARYRGTRKNLFDMRRAAAIQNLETAQRKAA
jgi:hypothetical protein